MFLRYHAHEFKNRPRFTVFITKTTAARGLVIFISTTLKGNRPMYVRRGGAADLEHLGLYSTQLVETSCRHSSALEKKTFPDLEFDRTRIVSSNFTYKSLSYPIHRQTRKPTGSQSSRLSGSGGKEKKTLAEGWAAQNNFYHTMLRISQELLFVTGEKLPDNDVDHIFKLTGMEEDLDGNIKYEGLRTKITFVYAWPSA